MSKLTPAQRHAYLSRLWHRDGPNNCFYCGCDIPRKLRTLDHLFPHSKGGGVSNDNIVLCCRPCNNAKADMTLAEFVDFVAANGGIHRVKAIYGRGSHSRTAGTTTA